MANANSMVSLGSMEHQIFNDAVSSRSNNIVTATSSIISSGDNLPQCGDPQCFVCDVKVQGRHYALATCKTQSSRSKIIEKLGELVGERYMVVISEDDVICRSCANLVNTLDRLEMEMHNVRDHILRFLEQKYSLEEGELLDSGQKRKPCQPPQITKSNAQNSRKDSTPYSNVMDRSKDKKVNSWMQCDKCKYTTHHNSFMIHHVKDHDKEQMFCNKCSAELPENQQGALHLCTIGEQKNRFEAFQENEKAVSMKYNNDNSMNVSAVDKIVQQRAVPIMPVQTYSQLQIPGEDDTVPLIRLSNSEDLHIQNILASEAATISYQPLFVRVLQHVNEGLAHPSTEQPNSESEMIIKVKENSTKQLLTLTEEGSLEMVEVASWPDTQSSDPDSDMHFS